VASKTRGGGYYNHRHSSLNGCGSPLKIGLQVGNGLFWVVPFLLQWLASRTIGSGLIDNGRLDDKHFGCGGNGGGRKGDERIEAASDATVRAWERRFPHAAAGWIARWMLLQ
jgi:hypothetical protein